MTPWQTLQQSLPHQPRTWLVTGAAGFIGSHLLETLLHLKQRVVGLDNFATGSRHNLEQVRGLVGPERWQNFTLIEGDICDFDTCLRATQGVDFVLHQAALGSVPRSLEHPADSHASNVNGCLNVFLAARDRGVKRVVYASSSAVYGDHPDLPKREDNIGHCLSPYAATKLINEIYADVCARCYGLEPVGLRYFNVFGPRQDPNGPYAAVIPKWIAAMLAREPIYINGDGETSRDFCYVANVVQANLLAATVRAPEALNQAYNVALHTRTSLNQLFALLKTQLLPHCPWLEHCQPVHRDFRPGDVRHSEADIAKAGRLLGYVPTHTIEQGLAESLDWYRQNL
ncbi:MAG TPA: SDR family oxidoreductase [Verrucomicrobiota bacterium]|nr:SDR family oxidoreductase [Verrucomicrobiota bacterium]